MFHGHGKGTQMLLQTTGRSCSSKYKILMCRKFSILEKIVILSFRSWHPPCVSIATSFFPRTTTQIRTDPVISFRCGSCYLRWIVQSVNKMFSFPEARFLLWMGPNDCTFVCKSSFCWENDRLTFPVMNIRLLMREERKRSVLDLAGRKALLFDSVHCF